jgi:signal transduction histidine kinase
MKSSFRLHVFLVAVVCALTVIFSMRMIARYSGDEPLLNYFSSALARHLAKELVAPVEALSAKQLQANLEKSIDGIETGEMEVFFQSASPANENQKNLKNALASGALAWEKLDALPGGGLIESATLQAGPHRWKVLQTPLKGETLFVATQSEVFRRNYDNIVAVRDSILKITWPFLLVALLLATFAISYAAFKPIGNLQKAFTQIHLHSSSEHINTATNYREFAEFIKYFNALIDRFRESYTQASRFSSDAAHELRTPLTIIRGHLQRLINQSPDRSDTQMQLSLVAEEVDRIIAITNKLLFLSQADSGHLALTQTSVHLKDMVGHMVDDLRSFSPNLVLTNSWSGSAVVWADRDLMYQLLSNLFANAIKYNDARGVVEFKAHSDKQNFHFSLSNTTQLTLDGLDDRVFERFYRHLDVGSQSLSTGSGSGLGLSLCKEIVLAHGGQIGIRTSPDRTVTIFASLPWSPLT